MKVPFSTLISNSKLIHFTTAITPNFFTPIGDEHFYQFIGKQSGINFLDIIHPDYREEFINECKTLDDDCTSRIICLVKDFEDIYQLMDLCITNNEKIIGGETVLDIKAHNITAIEKRFVRYSDNLNKYRIFLSMYKDFLFDYDITTGLIAIYMYLSRRPTHFIKCNIEELRDLNKNMFPNAEEQHKFSQFLDTVKLAQTEYCGTIMFPALNEENKDAHYEVSSKIVRKMDGSPLVLGTFNPLNKDGEDVTPYYATNEGKDPLTGLFNKRACHECSDYILSLGEKGKHYMIVIDIDDFKNINDTYGHLVGDEVISKVADIISSTLNGRGICGRFGGDEFFILTSNIRTEVELRTLLTSMHKKILYAYENTDYKFKITLSMGISLYPNDGTTYDELFKKADKCLYLAKDKGKHRYIIYNENKHGKVSEEFQRLRDDINPMEKAEKLAHSVGDIAATLLSGEENCIPKALKEICTAFSLDGVRIYSDNPLQLTHHFGDYKKFPDITEVILSDGFLDLYNKNNTLICSNMEVFDGRNRDFSNECVECDIMSTVTFHFTKEDGSHIFFFYDIFNHLLRWNESDKNYILALSKIITKIL